MTKREFLTALELGLVGLPAEDKRRSLEYYSEMIDDRIDDGVAEEEAVQAVGSLEEIVSEIRASAGTSGEEKSGAGKKGKTTYPVDADFSKLRIETKSADVELAMSDNGRCYVDCKETENARYTVEVENGTLVVKQNAARQTVRGGWFSRIIVIGGDTGVTVYLTKTQLEALDLKTVSGDVEIPAAFSFGEARLKTTSGDIDFAAAIETELTVETVSGDIELKGVAAERIGCETISGDIQLKRCDAEALKLTTVSGDVGGTLLTGKTFMTRTVSGDKDVPGTSGGLCEISTVSGDIGIRIAQ